MTEPRGIEERIRWFLDHNASGPGMCAQHSWHSLGGDTGAVPAWGCANANEVYDKVKKSGRYWTGTPKRGSLVLWKYGNNGHAAIMHDSDDIDTTNPDPDNSAGTATDVEDLSYPSKWGGSSSARIYTDQYNGVRFPIGDDDEGDGDDVKHVFLYLHTSDAMTSRGKGSYIPFDSEASDEGGFHSGDDAQIRAPWNSVGTYMFEGSGDAKVSFYKFDANDEKVGEIGLSEPGGDLTIVQDLPKGYRLRVIVREGSCPDARLKADIRER